MKSTDGGNIKEPDHMVFLVEETKNSSKKDPTLQRN